MLSLIERNLGRLGLGPDGGGDLARSSAMVLFLIAASAVLGLVAQVALTRALGAVDYGRYAVAVSWSLVMAALAMAGLDGSIVRFASEYSEPGHGAQLRRFAEFIALFQLVAIAVMASVILFSPVGLAALKGMSHSNAIWMVLYVGSTTLLASLSSFFTALRRYLFAQLYQNLLRPALLIGCVLVAFMIMRGSLDAEFAFKITALTSVAALVPLLVHLVLALRPFGNKGPARVEAWRWLAFSGWVQIGNICNQAVIQVPILLIGSFTSPAQAGYYAIAARVSSLVTMGLSAVGLAIGPMISGAHARRDLTELAQLARTAARLGTVISVVAAVALVAGGPSLMSIFGAGFSQAYLPLMILLAGAIFSAFSGVNAILLAMTDQPRFAVQALLMGAATNVVSSCVLIPSYGAVGAAIGTTIGAIISNVMMVVRIRRTIGIDSTAMGLSRVRVQDQHDEAR